MSGPPFTVRAVFEYSSGHDDDLKFPIGQVVTVTAEEDAEWYVGEYTDASGIKQEGIFPKSFVERYEPPAPPRPARPTRTKKESEPAPVEPPVPVSEPQPQAEPEVAEQPVKDDIEPVIQKPSQPQSPKILSSPAAEVSSPPPLPKQALAPAPAVAAIPAPPPAAKAPASKPPPPAVADKPSGSSFRDRIAAFNKSAAAPVAPFKPGGPPQPSSFVKKQFVAPPPSKDSFVAPPREPAPKIYKREEDPEVKEQIAREPPVSESRPPPPPPQETEEGGEDQPKPTSLKDRIALLQKQQLEQAQRHAESAQKKEKPKPPKKPVEQPTEPTEQEEELEPSSFEAPEASRDPSAEMARPRAPPAVPTPFSPTEEISESNDADYSAAADSEDVESSTGKDEEDEEVPQPPRQAVEQQTEQADEEEEAEEHGLKEAEEEAEEEEEEMDPETRRRMELRNRMAKMSGGMGMMGLFGPPGGLPGMGPPPTSRRPKTPGETEKKLAESEPTSPGSAPPVPMIPLPGMTAAPKLAPSADIERDEESNSSPVTEHDAPRDVPDIDEVTHENLSPIRSLERPPPVPPTHERSPPAPPAPESRPVSRPAPPPVPVSPPSVPGNRPVPLPPRPSTGDESDDELSLHTRNLSLNPSAPIPSAVPAPALPDYIDARRQSTYEPVSPVTQTPVSEKRASRVPPPIPSTQPPLPGRAPPGQMRRRSTIDSRASASASRQAGDDVEGEVTEYDGDYDTDIASGVKHKDALRSHERDSSFDADDSLYSPRSPQDTRLPPPIPQAVAPRAAPPPPPSQPRNARGSIDTPRGPPPPPPPPKEEPAGNDDDDYDPFNYATPQHRSYTLPPVPSVHPDAPPPPPPPHHAMPPPLTVNPEYDDQYEESPVQSPPNEPQATAQHKKRSSFAPPPPLTQAPPLSSPSTARSQRASMDMLRGPPNVRRSMDVGRPSVEQGFIATDVDLAENTIWWTHPNTLPPAFQGRKDILFEVEESSSSKRGGKTTVSKDVYILFMDYSQTVITVLFDSKNPSDASFEQRHEPSPLQPRQDQLEQAHVQIGTRISEAINAIQNTTVGDGTPFGLVQHLLSPLPDALLPIGTRAYGAAVYSNLANASVTQNDEIRAGDIVSFRNARFQGHRGTMHQKYNSEVGKPDHVGIVVDWDGTKKKIRAWEQGRENKKIKMESFKLNDMRSGECKVWRVMPRSWVGWESTK
ncbi:hypothetical protein N7495_000202 [Penicillium taxi]|uniref:uncharacterized protein n=1 Tax=Penicillium taxi TaxID=168475 RepID=UPI002544F7F9|nr:uncharacterized protein N7495_000202 [Penicillium taxi]KAJ5907520.1 hypothetical protein N7495_000202 [Penicillium taxi]